MYFWIPAFAGMTGCGYAGNPGTRYPDTRHLNIRLRQRQPFRFAPLTTINTAKPVLEPGPGYPVPETGQYLHAVAGSGGCAPAGGEALQYQGAGAPCRTCLAAHTGRDKVEPGEFIEAQVDIALGNDITAPIAIQEFRSMGATRVFDAERVALVVDASHPFALQMSRQAREATALAGSASSSRAPTRCCSSAPPTSRSARLRPRLRQLHLQRPAFVPGFDGIALAPAWRLIAMRSGPYPGPCSRHR